MYLYEGKEELDYCCREVMNYLAECCYGAKIGHIVEGINNVKKNKIPNSDIKSALKVLKEKDLVKCVEYQPSKNTVEYWHFLTQEGEIENKKNTVRENSIYSIEEIRQAIDKINQGNFFELSKEKMRLIWGLNLIEIKDGIPRPTPLGESF